MPKKLLLISIDAMISKDIEIMKELPAFGSIIGEASIVKNVLPICPTLTHPVHVSIGTGCYPNKHGIISNDYFLPGQAFSPWLEKADLVKVPIFPQIAKQYGYTCASVFWPLTIGMDLDWVLGRAWVHERNKSQQQTIKDNSTEGLFDEVAPFVESCWGKEHYEESDSFCFLSAEYLLRKYKPDITLIHVVLMDHIRHAYGVFSDQLAPAYKFLDDGMARLLDAMKDAGTLDDTIICITGDHGQLDIDRVISLNRFFVDSGLIRLNDDGSLQDWDAYAHSASLTSYIHVNASQSCSAKSIMQLLLDNKERLGIAEILTREQTQQRYHLDGDFDLLVETDGHTAFSPRWTVPLETPVDNTDYRTSVAGHGHFPEKGEKPAFIVRNPYSSKRITLESGNIVDQAPTMARLLGFDMPNCDGTPISQLLD